MQTTVWQKYEGKLASVNLQFANLRFNSGGMSASGDFSVPISFPRNRDPGN